MLYEIQNKEQKSLIPLSFFQASEFKFRKELEESVKRMNNGSDLETEIVTIGSFCHNEFEITRNEANGIFSKWVEDELAHQESKMREVIEAKDKEIRDLQDKLDSLDQSRNNSEHIRILDKQRREAEEHVKETWKTSQTKKALDMIKKNQEDTRDQMDNILKDFFEELNEIKKEIQQNSRNVSDTIEDILGQTQYMYKVNVKSLVRELKLQYSNTLEHITLQYNIKEEKIREAYEAQKKILNNMINETTALNLKLEKKAELKSLINGIHRSNPDNQFLRSYSFIICNVQEIRGIDDILDRRSRVEDIFNKVSLFSSLFGREDLGVKAKTSDLEAIKLWLDRTNMNAILERYKGISQPAYNFTDMSWEKTNTFNGSDIGRPLLNAKQRLENQINNMNGPSKGSVQANLASIFEKSAAENVVKAILSRPWHWRQHIYNLHYYKNGSHVGDYWKEYQGRYWACSWGIFGYVASSPHASIISPSEAWQNKAQNEYKKDLNETINAINHRAKLLFDFETNPDSPLQRLYQESREINPSVIDFPSTELDTLVKQCNDFIKNAF